MQTEQVPVAKLFDMREENGVTLEVPSVAPKGTPARKENYIFRKDLLSKILMWHMQGQDEIGLNLYGPTSGGKTSLVRQIANRLRIPLFELHATDETEANDLTGEYIMKDGNTVWINGPLTAAAEAGGWFMIDEADQLPPSVMMKLKSPLDGGGISIIGTGQFLQPQPGFRIITTMNTDGGGDSTGRYAGTQPQNIAVMNCMTRVEVPYLDEESETRLLMTVVPGMPEDVVKTLVSVANAVRTAFLGEDSIMNTVLSTRELIRSMRYLVMLHHRENTTIIEDVNDALALSVGKSDQAMLTEIVQRYFGDNRTGGAT